MKFVTGFLLLACCFLVALGRARRKRYLTPLTDTPAEDERIIIDAVTAARVNSYMRRLFRGGVTPETTWAEKHLKNNETGSVVDGDTIVIGGHGPTLLPGISVNMICSHCNNTNHYQCLKYFGCQIGKLKKRTNS